MAGIPADDPINTIVDHCVNVRFDDLPAGAIRSAQYALLDTIGAAAAGHRSDFGRLVVRRAVDTGGRPDAVIIGSATKVPAAEAAFVNANLARALELDDVHEDSPRVGLGHGGHINTMVVPAALAALETAPQPVSGKQLIVALALGADLIARVRLAGGNAGKLGWEGPTFGGFGAAVAFALTAGLGRDVLRNAMGAVYAQCAGNVQATTDGGWDVWLNAGTAARAGVLAVELARAGYRGTRDVLSGSSGLYPLYFRGEYHERSLLGQLGEYFESENVSIKPYATCKATHHAIYTAIRLVERHRVNLSDIERIIIGSSLYKMRLTVVDAQGVAKARPTKLAQAQFHMAYSVAIGLVRKSVFPDDIEQSLDDPAIMALADRIEVVHEPAKDRLQEQVGYPPDDVRIILRGGAVLQGCEEFVTGHPREPMAWAQLQEKFQRCLALGAASDSPAGLDGPAIVSCIGELPDRVDARVLCSLLRPSDKIGHRTGTLAANAVLRAKNL